MKEYLKHMYNIAETTILCIGFLGIVFLCLIIITN